VAAALAAVPAAVAAPMGPHMVLPPACVRRVVPTILVMAGGFSPATRTTSTPGTTVH
jgi:hypothetical protein